MVTRGKAQVSAGAVGVAAGVGVGLGDLAADSIISRGATTDQLRGSFHGRGCHVSKRSVQRKVRLSQEDGVKWALLSYLVNRGI